MEKSKNKSMNTSFANLMKGQQGMSAANIQRESAASFADVVRKCGLVLARPNKTPSPIVIGIASYSPDELSFLDGFLARVLSNRASLLDLISVFDVCSCTSMADFDLLIPGVGNVLQTPVVAIFDCGELSQKATGLAAKDLLLSLSSGEAASDTA